MRFARHTALAALTFIALSGLVGGVPLILHAHGEPWWMTQSLLQYSPFHSYLLPGIILFFAIGVLSCWVLLLTIKRAPGYGHWVALQGCILIGWIVVEVLMLRLLMWAHWLYAACGLVLLISGMKLLRKSHANLEAQN
jgi:hypothetical protein